ncbi:hypothetical protein CX710_000050 [Shigella flexneri]|nr:hypothetical protein [Shigella flexneri]
MKALRMLIAGLLIFSPVCRAGYYLATPTAAEAVTDSGSFAWDNLVIQSVLAGNSSTGGIVVAAHECGASYGHYAVDYITVPTIIKVTPKSYIKVAWNAGNTGWVLRKSNADYSVYTRTELRSPGVYWSCSTTSVGDRYPTVFNRPDIVLDLTLVDGGDLDSGINTTSSTLGIGLLITNNDAASLEAGLNFADSTWGSSIPSGGGVGWDVSFEMQNKCSSDISELVIEHGVLKATEIENHESSRVNFDVKCLAPASVTVSVVGSKTIDGKTLNYTECKGDVISGIFFDEGKYEHTYNNVSNLTVPVYSRLDKKGNNIAPGEFDCSGMLSFSYK